MARGIALSAEDRLRGAIIERLMCDYRVELGVFREGDGGNLAVLQPALKAIEPLEADGLVLRQGDALVVTERGQPFVRSVCAAFDTYLDRTGTRHSPGV